MSKNQNKKKSHNNKTNLSKKHQVYMMVWAGVSFRINKINILRMILLITRTFNILNKIFKCNNNNNNTSNHLTITMYIIIPKWNKICPNNNNNILTNLNNRNIINSNNINLKRKNPSINFGIENFLFIN